MRRRSWYAVAGPAVLAALVFLACAPALAQTSTAVIKGTVSDEKEVLPGATVVAINSATGFQYPIFTDAGGNYVLTLPPATYEIQVSSESYQPLSRTVEVLVGQALTVNFRLSAESVLVENVTVVGENRIAETRTSEVATNVTRQQIEALPQQERNFLTFASLAPGVQVTGGRDGDPRYGSASFRGNGLDARQVNVFVDGLSFKNDVIKGGAFMQDASIGNPFPQSAVQEYRVIASNFKAEYERAGSAIITSVTRSGTNAWQADAFALYSDEGMMEKTDFQDDVPNQDRTQYGISGGGPIIKDKLFFFAAYERREDDKYNNVNFSFPTGVPDSVRRQFAEQDQGDVLSPFEEDLLFGKLNWQPAPGHNAELSFSWRDESDRRDFGGTRAFSAGVDQQVETKAVTAKYQFVGSRWSNDATLAWQNAEWLQGAIDMDTPQLDYFGIGTIGGRSTIQDITQDRLLLRDDFTFSLGGYGQHTIKTGVNMTQADYDYDNAQDSNPIFRFRSEDQWLFPFEATIGFGNSAAKFDTRQYGLYVQDDWAITPQFELNLGVRWDYDENMLNNDWSTPRSIRRAVRNSTQVDMDGRLYSLGEIIDLDDYISTGGNRDSYSGAIQPRIGFSADLTGNGRSVLFGSWGRFYDRVILTDIYEEQHKFDWRFYRICFTDPAAGAPPSCPNPIPWDDSYLSKDGLRRLIDEGVTSGPEIWLLNNNTKPPRTDQWSVGFRQGIQNWVFTLGYNNVKGYNGLIWWPASTPDATPDTGDRWGHLFFGAPDYGLILYSTTDRRTWYEAVYLQVERPYRNRWGMQVTYTNARSFQLGREEKSEGTGFAFDFFQPEWLKDNRYAGNNDERHRVVGSFIFGLPWDIRLSSFITLGSGVPYTVYDYSNDAASIRWNGARPPRDSDYLGSWAYESVDLRAEKFFPIGRSSIGIQLEAFNLTDFKNYCGYVDFWLDPNLGTPTCQYNPRRFQVGMKYSFR
ncbi:MAG: TonB-dependent receptor [Acidobacteria bacterium]|nr:TonB-dependent receptor [Acidobacteriota bacterium]